MSCSHKRQAIFQLVAVSLHNFLLGLVLLASVPPVPDRDGAFRAARESRLATLDDFIERTSLDRGAKRYDSQNPAGVLAAGILTRFQNRGPAFPAIGRSERMLRTPTAGALSIRSPPSKLFV